jgi:hypothetical protein
LRHSIDESRKKIMNSETLDPRARLRQLLSIPEGKRTDAEWDEIVSIEIDLGPGKSIPLPRSDSSQPGPPGRSGPPRQQNKKPKGPWKQKPGKKPPQPV